jgi:uncharacterized protein YbbC (DUF1343 family)
VAELLEERGYPGVSFEAVTFTPEQPGDNKYPGRRIPGVRITVTDRDRVPVSRVGAALVWALGEAHPDSLRARTVDERLGSTAMREALLAGEDPDRVIDRLLPTILEYEQTVRKYHLYR